MDVQELAPGLVRWTAPHPEWQPSAEPGSPADWEREVGCVFYEAPDAAIFIDPLLPPARARFWRAFDRRVRRRERAVVLTTIAFHRRSRDAFVERYGATTSRAKRTLPEGVVSLPIRGAGETIFWLEERHALVPGDRILGGPEGGLRLCPESWLRYLPSGMTRRELATALRPLLELPIELVLVSHGEPVLSDGRAALEAALA
jgi:hypothetical protein